MSDVWLWGIIGGGLMVAYWHLTVPRGLPPGVNGIPVLGYIPFVNRFSHISITKLGKKFGGLFYIYFGSRLFVILDDYATAKEAFIKQGDVFSGRPHDILFKDSNENNYVFTGLTATDGEFWKQHRRFLINYLRDYGVGKASLEPKLLNEIGYLIEAIKKQNGVPFDIKNLLNCSFINNIHILTMGERYDYDHPITKQTLELLAKFLNEAQISMLNTCFPWSAYVPGFDILIGRKTTLAIIKKYLEVVEGFIKGVKKDYKDGDVDNYIQAYLTEKNARAGHKDEIFTDIGLLHITRDLLSAGTDTGAATVLWSLLYLTNHQDVQRNVQKEIDHVIGREREPSYNDRINMPYTEATLCEIHRIVSLVPLTAPHRNLRETNLLGYRIPPDTMVLANVWSIHHDPKLWGDPENFRPDRFINKDGKLIKPDYLIPFSLGKRACVGEPLARMELFLYFVSLLQHFNFVPHNGKQSSLEAIPSFILRPKSGIVCAKPRED